MIYAEGLFGYFFVIISYLLGPAGVLVPKRQFTFIFFIILGQLYSDSTTHITSAYHTHSLIMTFVFIS